jgi:oligopeptide/dipeptide ABC transporter ATP-binding protein
VTTPSTSAAARDGAVPVVEVTDLRVYFRSKERAIRAVDGVSFVMLENEIVGLVGETGCGKSVTARSLIGLLPIPPAIIAGGSVIFRPGGRCLSCRGAGCSACKGSGNAICAACGGGGCQVCGYTGRPTLDLLKVTPAQLRAIRGVRIAMIFQDPSKALNPALNVRAQIAEVLFQHRTPELLEVFPDGVPTLVRRAAHQRSKIGERWLLRVPPLRSSNRRLQARVDDLVSEALAEVQIPNPRKIMRSFPHELSGGMKQRVMIAQAMACDPDVLIADEPTTALDTTVQARILELIIELQQRRRAAVLYISHDLSLVRLVCDRVAVMYAGQIAETGNSDDLFHNPKHPYTQALLSAIPSVAHRGGKLTAIRGSVPEFADSSPMCRFSNRCPHAAAICPEQDPPLRSYWGDSHSVACFGYERGDAWGRTEDEMPSLQEKSSLG